MSFASDFGGFDGRAWINCAHQGPLPGVAGDAVVQALTWKLAPHTMEDEAFTAVPRRLKEVVAELIGAAPDEIVLGNSATYGLHLVANGLRWRPEQEVLVMDGDFPATTMPWVGLRHRGVRLRVLDTGGRWPSAGEVADALRPCTRVFCASWVNSFTGEVLDVEGIGAVLRERDILFVVNGSQAVGARGFRVSELPVDVLTSCGYKWLCGPYGTGFCWMRAELIDALEYNQTYWLTTRPPGSLDSMRDQPLEVPPGLGAKRYDVFCTANFLNFLPWTRSLEYLLGVGMDRVARHDQALVDRLVRGLEERGYDLTSPREGPARSTLVVASHADPSRNPEIHGRLAAAGVDIALREGALRFSPHLYNTVEDVERAMAVL